MNEDIMRLLTGSYMPHDPFQSATIPYRRNIDVPYRREDAPLYNINEDVTKRLMGDYLPNNPYQSINVPNRQQENVEPVLPTALLGAAQGISQKSAEEDKEGGLGIWGTALLAAAHGIGSMRPRQRPDIAPVNVGNAPPVEYKSPYDPQKAASLMPILMQYLGRR